MAQMRPPKLLIAARASATTTPCGVLLLCLKDSLRRVLSWLRLALSKPPASRESTCLYRLAAGGWRLAASGERRERVEFEVTWHVMSRDTRSHARTIPRYDLEAASHQSSRPSRYRRGSWAFQPETEAHSMRRLR